MKRPHPTSAILALLVATSIGCLRPTGPEVVVYTALDQDFSEPIFADFTERTGIRVLAKFDTESTKTVGLVEAILAERARPRCDLFWNNEILHTLRLEKQGLLVAYCPPIATNYPAIYRSPQGTWHGFAARARVLLVNTRLVPKDRWPKSIHALGRPQWKDRAGLAKPLFGTTATHAACLFARWGDERAKAFFGKLKGNVKIMAGNRQVAMAVAAGQLEIGLTDTDDAIIELEKGMPVEIIYPDQEPDGLGTLFIPNTLALIRGSRHGDEARQLIDYLLSPDVEKKLARGPSAQIPLNSEVRIDLRVKTPQTVKAMQVDFAKAADVWDRAAEFLRDEFTGR